ncbi:hypothetical protein OG604_44805 [Streptomyces sp. NBC_01231]|nr:hypothetical protein OG604_44805 [Streptomyces sp. NBC_01231]
MKFVQIIDFETGRIDEMRELDGGRSAPSGPGSSPAGTVNSPSPATTWAACPSPRRCRTVTKEVVVLRDDLIKSMQDLPEHTCPAVPLPGKKVRRGCYSIDEALRDASYDIQTTISPTAIKVIWEEDVRLLTSNGLHDVPLPAQGHRHQLR